MYKHLIVSVGLLSGLACVYAQPSSNTWRQDGAMAGGHSVVQTQAQRQAELRSALRAQRVGSSAMERTRSYRQLNAQERSELRQQIRQQWREGMRK
jgi:hypothetical protein